MSVDAIGSFDEELIARSLPSASPFIPSTPVLPAVLPVPQGHSPRSTLEPAPSRHVLWDLLDVHQETERLTSRRVKQFEAEIQENFAEIERLKAEKEEALKHEALATQSRNTWGALAHVSQYISGAAAVAIGVSTGGWGLLLAAAGVVGLGNRVLNDTNLLPIAVSWITESKERQREILNAIEMGAFILQMGLGLASGFTAFYTGAFATATALSFTQKAASYVATGSLLLGTGSRFGMEVYKKRISNYNARAAEVQGEINLSGYAISEDTAHLNQFTEANQALGQNLQASIRTLEVPGD